MTFSKSFEHNVRRCQFGLTRKVSAGEFEIPPASGWAQTGRYRPHPPLPLVATQHQSPDYTIVYNSSLIIRLIMYMQLLGVYVRFINGDCWWTSIKDC